MTNNHININDIIDYVLSKTDRDKTFKIQSHLVFCDECKNLVKRYITIHNNYEKIFEDIRTNKYLINILKNELEESLASSNIKPGLLNQVKNWIGSISTDTLTALNIAVDSTKKKAKIINKELSELFNADQFIPLMPASQPVAVLGSKENKSIIVESKDSDQLKINIDPELKKISVKYSTLKKPWPLALLILKKNKKIIANEFYHPEETNYLLTEFASVESGEYLLILAN